MELPLIIRPMAGLTEDMFFDLCQANEQLFMERDKDGNIIVMAPTGSDAGFYNSDINGQIWSWNRLTKAGYVFDSSTGFTLPNGAVRSPDVSWIVKSRYEALSASDRKKFAPVCPDLVIEVRSQSDNLTDLKEKMEEYRDNGSKLGWLIDQIGKKIYIYRENGVNETKNIPAILNGEDLLPGLNVEINL